ncbi:recombinase family protein [Streptomyces sp. NPDC001937]
MKTSARARTAGLYIRISDDREGAGLGVKRQEHGCRLLVASLGWTVVEVYDDNDMSASDRRKKRKNYHRMLDDIESGHIDAVVTWHPPVPPAPGAGGPDGPPGLTEPGRGVEDGQSRSHQALEL